MSTADIPNRTKVQLSNGEPDLAQTVIQSGKPVCETFNLDADAAGDDGMICGGTVEVIINRIYPSDSTTIALYETLLIHLKQRNTVHLIISIRV